MDGSPRIPADGDEAIFAHVQELQERLESAGDLVARALSQELTSALVQMYGLGLERIVDGLDVPIVQVYLDRVWGSVRSEERRVGKECRL